MQITKCDICKKKIEAEKERVWVWLRGEKYINFELCEKCAQPISKYLASKKLIKK